MILAIKILATLACLFNLFAFIGINDWTDRSWFWIFGTWALIMWGIWV